MEAKTFHSEVTFQSSSSRKGAANHPFPPFEERGSLGMLLHLPNFLGPRSLRQPSQRPTSGPPLSQDSRLPVSCPSPLPAPRACGCSKMADGDGLGEAATAAASPPAPAPGQSLSLGWRERLRAGLAGTGASLWFVAGLGLLYVLRVPLRLCENLAAGERPRPPWGWAGEPGEGPGTRGKGQRFSAVTGGLRALRRWCAT